MGSQKKVRGPEFLCHQFFELPKKTEQCGKPNHHPKSLIWRVGFQASPNGSCLWHRTAHILQAPSLQRLAFSLAAKGRRAEATLIKGRWWMVHILMINLS